MSDTTCIIVGASHAAAQLAPSLRQGGWSGRILVIGDEPALPYHRPPLSKQFLAGDKAYEDILIRQPASYENAGIEFRLGTAVSAIERAGKTVVLDSGERLAYSKLALTTGSRVRRVTIPGAQLPGVFYLRNLQDAGGIRRHARAGARAVVVGGGYIGLETAAVLNKLGMAVTVLEMMPRILQRVTTEDISAFYTRVHREQGVTIVNDIAVSALRGEQAVTAVVCSNGEEYPADLVVIGVGIVPNQELAAAAGLAVDNGIVVDEHAVTSDPDIVAAGDCTSHFNPIYGRTIRLESVQNAVDQAKVAAAALCGQPLVYNALPWFWSDQYDVKLQIAGLSHGYDQVVIRGDTRSGRRFSAFYLREGRVIAVDALNNPQDFMLGKQLILERLVLDPALIRNVDVPLKNLLPAKTKASAH